MSDIVEQAKKRQKEDLKNAEKNQPIEISYLETEDWIAEQVYAQNGEHNEHSEHGIERENRFIIFNKSNPENLEYKSEIELNNKKYIPINNKLVQEKLVLLSTDTLEYGTDKELVSEISQFVNHYCQLPPFYEKIIPYIILFYWVFDRFPFVPYLQFSGLTGTGKSTALEVIGSLCYKAIKTSGAITVASIFRLANQWKGTLLLNEFDLGDKRGETYRNMIQLLRSGVEDDPVFRIEGEGKKQTEFYRIKSPRLFSSQSPIADAALGSRTIDIHMDKATRRLPLYKGKEYYKQAQLLRNKLLLWRFRHLDQINLEEIEYGMPELETFDKRVQQVITGIFYLADKDIRETLITLIKEQEIETKRQRLDEIEGQIFLFIVEKWDLGERVAIGEIADYINELRFKQGYTRKITAKKIGDIIRKTLGIMTERTNEGYKIILTPRKIKGLKDYYGVQSVPSSLSTQSSQEVDQTDTKEAFLDQIEDKLPF